MSNKEHAAFMMIVHGMHVILENMASNTNEYSIVSIRSGNMDKFPNFDRTLNALIQRMTVEGFARLDIYHDSVGLLIRLNYLYIGLLSLFLSIGIPRMAGELRLVGGLKFEKNGRQKFLCIRAGVWNKENDNAVRNIVKLFRNMGFKVKRMKINQLWTLIGFEEQTIEVDFVGANDVRIR